MKKYIFTLLCFVSLLISSCAAHISVQDGFLIHENLYQVPLPDETWLKVVSLDHYDALYFRCPGEQGIAIAHALFPYQAYNNWNFEDMKPQDYMRIYKDSTSLLYDPDIKELIEGPIFLKEKEAFKLVYRASTSKEVFCKINKEPTEVKGVDVFFKDPNAYFYCGICARFVVLRYRSTEDKFDEGLKEFQNLVDQFQIVNKHNKQDW